MIYEMDSLAVKMFKWSFSDHLRMLSTFTFVYHHRRRNGSYHSHCWPRFSRCFSDYYFHLPIAPLMFVSIIPSSCMRISARDEKYLLSVFYFNELFLILIWITQYWMFALKISQQTNHNLFQPCSHAHQSHSLATFPVAHQKIAAKLTQPPPVRV